MDTQLMKRISQFRADIKVMDISYMDDTYFHETMDTGPGDPVVKAAERAIETVTGEKAVLRSFTAWTDGGLINY